MLGYLSFICQEPKGFLRQELCANMGAQWQDHTRITETDKQFMVTNGIWSHRSPPSLPCSYSSTILHKQLLLLQGPPAASSIPSAERLHTSLLSRIQTTRCFFGGSIPGTFDSVFQHLSNVYSWPKPKLECNRWLLKEQVNEWVNECGCLPSLNGLSLAVSYERWEVISEHYSISWIT